MNDKSGIKRNSESVRQTNVSQVSADTSINSTFFSSAFPIDENFMNERENSSGLRSVFHNAVSNRIKRGLKHKVFSFLKSQNNNPLSYNE